ncbi:MAG: GIDE domain-containing protein, partial [Steroidobacteraceae bacterium]
MRAGASPHFYYGLAVLFAAAMAYAVFRCLASLRRDRFAADTPLARIRSAAQGYVRLEGRAGAPPDGALAAPLSGLACVWWDYRIERRQSTGRSRSEWQLIERATSVTPFALHDADGECLIGPVGADVTPTSHETWFGDTPRPIGVAASGHPAIQLESAYRYTERLIGPGAHLTVLGELRSHSAVESIDDAVRETLASWKQDQAALLARFDRDHDGQLDAGEWDAARAQAHRQVEASLGTKGSRESVVGQTTHGEPFLIAPLDGQH